VLLVGGLLTTGVGGVWLMLPGRPATAVVPVEGGAMVSFSGELP
jgi:hypothetical protein